jgi:hypothetical protein
LANWRCQKQQGEVIIIRDEVPGFVRLVDDLNDRAKAYVIGQEEPVIWTPEHVGDRMVAAYDVLGRLPISIWPKGAKGYWPDILRDEFELRDQNRVAERDARNRRARAAPSATEHDEMNEALAWPMRYLTPEALSLRHRANAAILADSISIWALYTAREWDMQAYLAERNKQARARARAMTLRGDARRAVAREITEWANDKILALGSLRTPSRIDRIQRAAQTMFKERAAPAPHVAMPGKALNEQSLNKWRKRAMGLICDALRRERVPVR